MKVYAAVLLSLACIGGGLMLYSSRGVRPADQAGIALVENDEGQLVPASDHRDAKRTEIPPPEIAGDYGTDEQWMTKFALIERSGQQIASDELKGQPYVAGFFFSTCPSICVRQNGKMKELQEQFKGKPIRMVSISCDPEVDQPAVLQKYAKRFDADRDQWLFFTGKMDYIRRVGAEVFRLGVERRGHPEKFALMDADGQPYGWYTWSDDAQWEALQRDITKMLAAGGRIESKTSQASSASEESSADTDTADTEKDR